MPHKLLLADDSVTIQRVIELTFADEDVSLTAVGDGRSAIEHIKTDPPDIVLADVGMPELDGYEVAAFIKNNPALAHIPVLLLTGAFEPVDEERARAVSCDGVLAKPFEPQMVITRVKELLADAARTAARPRPAQAPGRVPGPLPVETPADAAETITMEADEALARLDASTFPSEGAGEEAAPDAAGDEANATIEAVQIRRRPTMPVPDFGVPPADLPPAETLPAASQAALDDYFDRLGAAFSNLDQPQRGTPSAAEPEILPEADVVVPAPPVTEPSRPPDADAAVPEFGDDLSQSLAAAASEPVGEDALPEPAQAPFARAFSALLAAEQGEPGGEPLVSLLTRPSAPPIDEDALADRVARVVLERMSDRVVRDTVTDIVSRVAERLVREEIARIKASIR